MQMRMMAQSLAPGMKYGQEAYLGAEVFGVRGYSAQRLGGGGEQQVVDEALILQCQGSELLRQGEHYMEILDWQEVCDARLQPAGFG